MSSPAQEQLAAQEYLAHERASIHRRERIDGQIRPMPRNSRTHNRIVGNLLSVIRRATRGSTCDVFAMSLRVRGATPRFYAYPDLAAICEPPLFEDEHKDTLLNPGMVIEVTADETEVLDRRKFSDYGRLRSLREFILISGETGRVEQYVRDGNSWQVRFVEGTDAVLHLATLECTVPLETICAGVDLPPRHSPDPVTLRL